MKVEIRAKKNEAVHRMKTQIIGHLQASFAVFQHKIRKVEISIADENGPRGGKDQKVRMLVKLKGKGSVQVNSSGEDPISAASLASARAIRQLRELKRNRWRNQREARILKMNQASMVA